MKPFQTLLSIITLGLCSLSVAEAQAAVNRKAVLTWTAPAACASGAALSTCPVTGYAVQKLVNSAWIELGSTAAAVTTYTDQNLVLGIHTYRIVALSATTSPSDPSNQASKTIDAPGAPGAPTIVITITITP